MGGGKVGKKKIKFILFISMLVSSSYNIFASAGVNVSINGNSSPEGLSSTLQILIFLTFLTFLPAIVLTMTSFTRIIIVFSLLRNGLGTQTTPPNQVLIGLALFLTFFIMAPVVTEIKTEAVDPYINKQINEDQFLEYAQSPIKHFMLKQTRTKDLELFVDMSGVAVPSKMSQLPLHIVVPAFIISELKTAFEISFLLFIPFMVIDFIVSSVLMSMGMMMLPPAMISLPFKLLLFILVDGWHLIVQSLVQSFIGG